MSKKLLMVAIVSSTITTLSPAIYLGMSWLVICIVAFPIVLGATFVFVYFGDKLFRFFSLGKTSQLLMVLPIGFLGGLFVYLLLFSGNIFSAGVEGLSVALATQYSFLGLYAALVTWLLYNFGPLRVEPHHSNNALQTDAALPPRR